MSHIKDIDQSNLDKVIKKRHVLKVAIILFNMFENKTKPEVAIIKDVSILNHTIGRVLIQQFSYDPRNIATFLAIIVSLRACPKSLVRDILKAKF